MRISEEIIKVLDYLCEKLGIAIDWTTDNVLPYVDQLCDKFVKWQVGTSIIWILIAIATPIVIRRLIRDLDIWDNTKKLISICLACVAIIIIGKQLFDIVTCCTFPEKAICDYIRFQLFWHGN